MTAIINELISAILQVIAFSLIPFIFFLFRKDKSISFFRYIGLHRATGKSIWYAVIASVLFLIAGITMIYVDDGVRDLVLNPPSVTGRIRQVDPAGVALALIIIIAGIKTSLSEEIFFRGFIAKRLMNWLGYGTGNLVQSIIFGLVHLLLFWMLMNPTLFAAAFIFAFSSLAGWVIGIIKERYANQSIIPGWIAHGLGNTISYCVIVFAI